jgi:[amino group carrier protein]-lysine/ornithine hydrolase
MESESEKERRAALAERAVSIYSPSGEESEFASFLFFELRERALKPRIDGAGNVIAEVGIGEPSLLLCGHMDTVPGELEVKRVGNIIQGRGASDAKGALLSMLFAFEDIAPEVNEVPQIGKVIFAAIVEEETTSFGLKELLRKNVRADAAIFGEPCGAGKVTIGYRGHIPVAIEVQTEDAHASAPWLAINSAEHAYSIYNTVKNTWPADDRRSKNNSVSVALTGIEAGKAHNVIPGLTKMNLDVRFPLGIESKEVVTKLSRVVSDFMNDQVKIKVSFGEATEPYQVKLNCNVVRAIDRALLKSDFQKPEFVVKSGTGDMNRYSLFFDVDSVTYGPGDTKLSHTPLEHVNLVELFQCSEVLRKTAFEFFSLRRKSE